MYNSLYFLFTTHDVSYKTFVIAVELKTNRNLHHNQSCPHPS